MSEQICPLLNKPCIRKRCLAYAEYRVGYYYPYCRMLNVILEPDIETENKKPKEEARKQDFDPQDLINHTGWKNKKTGHRKYSEGTLAWGWDFRDQFKPETIEALEKMGGKLLVDVYEFTLLEKIVQTRKAEK